MNRYRYDLGHQSHMLGQVGRLQTHAVIPVVAGDSVKIQWNGALRLSPLKRYMTSDPKYDMMWFYVPHRHAYGQDWIDFIAQGYDESITFPTVTASGLQYLGAPRINGVYPYWLVHAYNAIYNRYIRNPTDDAALKALDATESSTNGKISGSLTARLKTIWSTGVDDDIAAATREVAVSGGVFDIMDLSRARRNMKTEVDRQYFGQRYNDVMGAVWGGSANADADERPTLLYRHSQFISGRDVNGTGDASLGTYTGKSISGINYTVPRKFCPEHGCLICVSVLRFPLIAQLEAHKLILEPQPSYLDIGGDPDLLQAEPPYEANISEFFTSGSAAIGKIPYGQHYRYQPSVVHEGFTTSGAFPFFRFNIASKEDARYCQDNEYKDIFSDVAFGHWQHHAAIAVDKSTVVPGPKSSMYAGVNDV